MGSVDSAKKLTQTVQNSKYTTTDNKEINRIHVSTLCPNSSKEFDSDSYAYKLAQLSGGIAVSNYNTAPETEVQDITSETVNVLASKAKSSKTSVSVSTNLIQILGEGNTSKYKVINSAGLNTINLKQKLTKGSAEDYDKDGITDWNEVNTRLIYSILARDSSSNVYSEGTIAPSALPTFADCRWYYSNSEEPKFYVEQGYEQFVNKNAAMYYNGDKEKVKEELNKIRILPLISDPTKPDSDGDGLLDCTKNSLNTIYKGTDDIRAFLYDDHPLCKDVILEWPVKYKNGDKATSLSSSFTEFEGIVRNNKAHCALDIAAPNGTPVYAALPGTVTFAGNGGSWGNTVEILSAIDGKIFLTKYNHLNECSVNTGDEIKSAGELIGKIGNTGSSYGNHLDFMVSYIKDDSPQYIREYLKEYLKNKENGGSKAVNTRFTSFNLTINPLLFNKAIAWSDRENFSVEKITKTQYNMIINFPNKLTHSCTDTNCNECKKSKTEIEERMKQK